MRIVYLILTIAFAFFIVTFSQDNAAPVHLQYFFLKSKLLDIVVPAYMLIFVALLIGVIITGFFGVVERFRLNRTISKLNRTIRALRKELRANEPPPIIEHQPKTDNV